MTEEPQRFGRVVRALRQRRGETLAEVAGATGISTAMLSRIERGERLPSPNLVEALARHFEVPLEYLMRERMLSQMAARYGRYHALMSEDLAEGRAEPCDFSLSFDPESEAATSLRLGAMRAEPSEMTEHRWAPLTPPESWRSRATPLFREAEGPSPQTSPSLSVPESSFPRLPENLALELVAAANRLIELADATLERGTHSTYREQQDLAAAVARLREAAARLERKIR
ncbi:MAG: helix-turn-helix domain-containing protein [Thermoleophilia bacterium]|nr:helix-turn-helix domain-containing protein [Thermoleophilia bacterium]